MRSYSIVTSMSILAVVLFVAYRLIPFIPEYIPVDTPPWFTLFSSSIASSFLIFILITTIQHAAIFKISRAHFNSFSPYRKFRTNLFTLMVSLLFGSSVVFASSKNLSVNIQGLTFDVTYLAAELINEAGPDFAQMKQSHAKILNYYLPKLENGFHSTLLRIWYPRLSPSARLRPAIEILSSKENFNQVSPQEDIKKAALFVYEYSQDLAKFSGVPKSLKSFGISSEFNADKKLLNVMIALSRKADDLLALQDIEHVSHESLTLRVHAKTRDVCMTSRIALLLILTDLPKFEIPNPQFSGLGDAFERIAEITEYIGINMGSEIIIHYASSMRIRSKLIKKINESDFVSAFQELTTWIRI